MAVPLMDLNGQNAALAEELAAAFQRVVGHGQFILGREVAAFEEAMAADLGVRHALGASSGTDALLMALVAADIQPGDEVICPDFTFFATAGSIARVGARPVFVDCRESDFNLDPAMVEAAITPKTRALLPVHLFGQMAEMDELNVIARRHGLVVIEDAAQSLGAAQHGKPAGTVGHLGCYSFFPTKNLGAFGDAGMLVTNDDKLAERALAARNHGQMPGRPKYVHDFVGGNFRLDALQAALLAVKQPHLAGYAARRAEHAAFYQDALAGCEGVALPRALEGNHHVWNQFTLRISGEGRRDAVRAALSARGIGSEVYYPMPMHRQPCFAHLGQGGDEFPVTEALCREVLSIPVFPELTESMRDEVAAGLRDTLAV